MFARCPEVPLYLIALAFGYIVCYLANREEKNLRQTGFTIGIVIIAISSLVILAKAALFARNYSACRKGVMQEHIMLPPPPPPVMGQDCPQN